MEPVSILGLILSIVSLIVAAIALRYTKSATQLAERATQLAEIERGDQDFHKRLDQFRLLTKIRTSDSTRIVTALAQRVRAKAGDIPRTEGGNPFCVTEVDREYFTAAASHMISKEGWLFPDLSETGEGVQRKPLRTREIRLEYASDGAPTSSIGSDEDPARKESSRALLPRRSATLADNILMFTDDRPFNATSLAAISVDIFEPTDRSEPKGERVSIAVKSGNYFDFINSCVLLEYEAAHALLVGQGKGLQIALPLRSQRAMKDFSNRHAQIGTDTLTVITNVLDAPGSTSWSTYFLVLRRSGKVSVAANLIDGVPAGTVQAATSLAPAAAVPGQTPGGENIGELVIETIAREFYEEILRVSEFEEMTNGTRLRHSPEDELRVFDIISNNTYLLGLGLQPLTGHLDILSVCVLDGRDPDCAAIFTAEQPSIGVADDGAGVGTREGSAQPLDIDSLREFVERHINVDDSGRQGEGQVSVKPFDLDTLKYYEFQYRSSPGMREICRLLQAESLWKELPSYQPATPRGE